MAKKKKEEEKLYCIKNISEKQIGVMRKSLEMYCRLGLMQFDHLVDDMFNWGYAGNFSDAYSEKRDQIEYHCREIRNLLVSKDDELNKYPTDSNWSLGIGSPKTPEKAQIAYEIEKDIELTVADKPRSKLHFSDETSTIVKRDNPREEKLKQIMGKLKDNAKG